MINNVEIDFSRRHDLQYVQDLNRRVANHLFPDRTSSSMFLKMYEEIGELVNKPGNAEEAADILIMVLDHMSRIGADAGVEIMLKLEKNVHQRKWELNPENGIYKHVEGT